MSFADATEMLRIAKIEKLIPMMYAYANLFALEELEARLLPFFRAENSLNFCFPLSIKEAAVILKLTEAEVGKAITEEELDAITVQGRFMVTDSAIKDYLFSKSAAG